MAAFGFGVSLGPRAARGRVGTVRAAEAVYDFTRGSLPAGATPQRGSVGGWRDAAGDWRMAAADEPRFAFDRVSGQCRGLTVESAATNLVAGADMIEGASWVRAGVSVPQAGTVIEAATGGNHIVRPVAAASFVAGQAYCWSAEVAERAGSAKRRPCLVLGVTGASGAFGSASIWVKFDAATGLVAVNGGGTTAPVAAGAEALPRGEWRLWVVATAVRTLGDRPELRLTASGGGTMTYTGDGASGLTVRRVQLEQVAGLGSGPTSWIATTDGAASRAADRLTLDWGRLGVADGPATVRYTLAEGGIVTDAVTIVGGRAEMTGPNSAGPNSTGPNGAGPAGMVLARAAIGCDFQQRKVAMMDEERGAERRRGRR